MPICSMLSILFPVKRFDLRSKSTCHLRFNYFRKNDNSLPYPNSQLANQKPTLRSWYPTISNLWPDSATVTLNFGYFGSTASRKNTNHGSTKLAWYAAEAYQKGTIRYIKFPFYLRSSQMEVTFLSIGWFSKTTGTSLDGGASSTNT